MRRIQSLLRDIKQKEFRTTSADAFDFQFSVTPDEHAVSFLHDLTVDGNLGRFRGRLVSGRHDEMHVCRIALYDVTYTLRWTQDGSVHGHIRIDWDDVPRLGFGDILDHESQGIFFRFIGKGLGRVRGLEAGLVWFGPDLEKVALFRLVLTNGQDFTLTHLLFLRVVTYGIVLAMSDSGPG